MKKGFINMATNQEHHYLNVATNKTIHYWLTGLPINQYNKLLAGNVSGGEVKL